MTNLRISVFSDDRLFCESILRILAEDPYLTVATYDDTTVPTFVRGSHQDIAVVDARMSRVLGWCSAFAAEGGCTILVGAPEDDAWAEEALTVGARGILTKTSRSEDLSKAIAVVRDGGIWARRRWLNASLKYFAATRNKPTPGLQLGARLSEREREVFYHAATGLGNKELADRLAISEATVKAHLTHIFQKLGVSGRAELAAAYHGLLSPVADPPRQTM